LTVATSRIDPLLTAATIFLGDRAAQHLIGHFADHDHLAPAALLLDIDLAANDDLPAPVGEGVDDAAPPADRAAGGEVRAGDDLHQLGQVISGLSITAMIASQTSPTLCGTRLVAMPTAMPTPPLTSRLGNLAGQHGRLLAGGVVVGFEVDGFELQIVEHLDRGLRQAGFGVTHGRGRVAVDRAEVALRSMSTWRMFQVLAHANQRGVDHRLTVGVVVAAGVAADLGALAEVGCAARG
jgi:hypothetical protein